MSRIHLFIAGFLCFAGLIAYPLSAQNFVQLGPDIHGHAFENFGHAVSMSSDGTVLAVGSNQPSYLSYLGADTLSGRIRVYAWDGSTWAQRGSDIEGEAKDDGFGGSVSLSSDGNIVAIGAPGNDDAGEGAGHVRVYAWDGASWVQRGSDIDGEAERNGSGESVSLSSDGNSIAIGAPSNSDGGDLAGQVRVYMWDGAGWVQKGSDIDGDRETGLLGTSVSLSADGNVVAVGAPSWKWFQSGLPGTVRVHVWGGEGWVQRGSDIDGTEKYEIGSAVSLSSDGSFLAVGAPGAENEELGEGQGAVRIFGWNGAEWIQRGSDIKGEREGDFIGSPISLSSDASLVAIGSPNSNNGKDGDAGVVRVFAWDGTAWVKQGTDIHGEDRDDYSGWSISLAADGNTIAIGATGNDDEGVAAGQVRVYRYQSTTVDIETAEVPDGPSAFMLMDPYPNPFNKLTRIRVQLNRATEIRLQIHDLLGRTVEILNERLMGPGTHDFEWDAADRFGNPMPSGLYIVRMGAAGHDKTRMVSLVR